MKMGQELQEMLLVEDNKADINLTLTLLDKTIPRFGCLFAGMARKRQYRSPADV
jgi:hypothetical protein